MLVTILLSAMIVGATCAFYFCYIAGVEGWALRGMLRPSGFMSMIVSVVSATILTVRVATWADWSPRVLLLSLLIITLISSIPFGAYKSGCDVREQKAKEREEARQRQREMRH